MSNSPCPQLALPGPSFVSTSPPSSQSDHQHLPTSTCPSTLPAPAHTLFLTHWLKSPHQGCLSSNPGPSPVPNFPQLLPTGLSRIPAHASYGPHPPCPLASATHPPTCHLHPIKPPSTHPTNYQSPPKSTPYSPFPALVQPGHKPASQLPLPLVDSSANM